jgi:hypothetical protein
MWLRDAEGLALLFRFSRTKSRSEAKPGAARAEGKPQKNNLLLHEFFIDGFVLVFDRS